MLLKQHSITFLKLSLLFNECANLLLHGGKFHLEISAPLVGIPSPLVSILLIKLQQLHFTLKFDIFIFQLFQFTILMIYHEFRLFQFLLQVFNLKIKNFDLFKLFIVQINLLINVVFFIILKISLEYFESGFLLQTIGVLINQQVELINWQFSIEVAVQHDFLVHLFDSFIALESAQTQADIVEMGGCSTILFEELMVHRPLVHAEKSFHVVLNFQVSVSIFSLKNLFFE